MNKYCEPLYIDSAGGHVDMNGNITVNITTKTPPDIICTITVRAKYHNYPERIRNTMNACEGMDDPEKEIKELRNDLRTYKAANSAIHTTLMLIEWGNYDKCPNCGKGRESGHDDECVFICMKDIKYAKGHLESDTNNEQP